ncbi:retrovirus-related pol polyprotein from transposon TNT 1-94 [Tanacetum coccineum]|uniref:Retrovirus-related pol polyprotein from transposon TNT 1-94 n=1 Tax=Tanacetum coccineum TaxID=301880 RepID=A0ABQ5BFB0_9ASTR
MPTRLEKKANTWNKPIQGVSLGIMPTEMELTLEQTQQGVSYEVSVFTMKMEILLEPTSNKLMVEHAEYDESNTYVLERFNTTAGNPVKKILLKLNLSDHRKLKDGGEVKEFQRSFRHSDTERLSRSDEVLKLKNFKKDATLKLFKSTNQERESILERAKHKQKKDRRVNDRMMQSKERKDNSSKALDAGLVVTESNETESERHILSSRSGNDTHTDDADINFVNDKQPMAEVQLSAEHNILANEQQHSKQSESVYDTCLLEKVDRNTTPESTNIKNEMLHKENEHLKQTYKDLYDSIKKIRVQTNNLNDALVAQVNSKTIENVNLKAQIQEKVFVNVALKNELRKLKGNSVDTKFSKPSILVKPVLQPPRNQSVVRQPNAFKSERPNFLKPRFASQVDVNNVLSKPVTPHYLPKVREFVFAKPQHVIAPGSSRNSSKESYGSNDMAHNYYLEEAKKKTQDKNRNLKPRKMPYAKTHKTPNACTPKPKSNNQTSRNWHASKSYEEMLKAMQKADHSRNPKVNSRAKIQPNKTRNSNKPVDPTSHTQKPGRKIVTRHSFSLNKSSVVHEKTNTPRSYLRWIPTGRIFNTAGLKWVPTGKTFTSSTTKVDCELPNGSNDYITNPYKCDQTLNVSAGTLNLSADQHPCFMIMASVDNTSGPVPQRKGNGHGPTTLEPEQRHAFTLQQQLVFLYYHMKESEGTLKSAGKENQIDNLLKEKVNEELGKGRCVEIYEETDGGYKWIHMIHNMKFSTLFNTTAGNPVKKILLKLNLSDHRKLKDGGEVKEFQRSFRHSDTERLSRSDEVLKLKNFKKDATLKLFKSTNQERFKWCGKRNSADSVEVLRLGVPIRRIQLMDKAYSAFEPNTEYLKIDQGVGSTSGIRACALRYFDLGKMELENSQNNSLAKLPILKLGEYEMWEIRIKQYFQIQDYALWEVIENGNSWVPIPVTAPESGPSTALKMTVPSTTEEKICKKNDVKARSLLLMALPNEHQLTFNQYADAQSMFIAIKARFGGNDATKKTQKALLKQQYENFNATSSESLDSIFNRLQKLVSRLAILGVDTPPEDLNVKFLRSLPSEWDTHVVVWMNKPDFETMGLDDLYNNFKIVEQKVKRTVAVNNDDKNLAFLTTSSPSSTNTINTANTGVSTGNTKVNTASTETSTASFSDATVYAFLSTQPQGSQLVHEDLEQIHDDDLEEMDLKWNMALLSMRARKFYQRTGRKIIIDGSSTAGYDKSKVECFNCHKMGHFARECRAPRSKDNRNWNQGSSSKAVRIEDASEKAMCAIDGAGFDWSDMAEDEIQANMALMAFTDSEVSNDKSCSKSCLQNYEALKKQYDDLIVKLDDTGFKAATYKRGLSILEAQVVKYKESEVLFSEEIALLKRSVGHKEYLMGLVKTELEKVKEEKEGFEFKLAKFEKSSKDLDDLLASQVTDKSKKGFGYNVVPSPHPLILNRPTPLDLSYTGLEEFKQPETKIGKKKFFHPANHVRVEEPKKARENTAAPIIEDWVSDDEEEVEPIPKVEKKIATPTATKKKSVKPEKPIRRSSRSVNTARAFSTAMVFNISNSQLNDKGFVDSGCSRHISGNIAHLSDFKDFDGGYVTFGGGANGGRITGKVPKDGLTCLVAKATLESMVKASGLKTTEILKNFIKEIENLVDKKVKIIRSDNGTEFKNKVMDEFCREKGIKREYSIARTPQQNGVAERKNRTLIEAANKTMLADSISTYNILGQKLVSMLAMGLFELILQDASILMMLQPDLFADVNYRSKNGTHDDCSLQNNGTADQQVNTASPEVNTGSREVSTTVPEVNIATPEDLMGQIPTSSEDTQVEDQEIELGNISPSYAVSSTPHTRIHKDHPIDHVIGDVQSSVQTRRMDNSFSFELNFLVHNEGIDSPGPSFTCLFACFLSQGKNKRVSKGT